MKHLLPLLPIGLFAWFCASAMDAPASAPDTVTAAPSWSHGYYADTFVSLSTPDFSHQNEFGYGLGVGYAFNRNFAADVRVTHAGLNLENNAVSTVGARLVSRLPFDFLSPYGFVGAAFDLGPDQWRLRPGVGAEIGMTKIMRGMSLIGEAGLDADLKGHSGFLLSTGLRWRF